MDEETRAHVAALTGGFMELCGILAQRHAVDRGDISSIIGIMQHALRDPSNAGAVAQLARWQDRILPLATDNLPLPDA